ncbi:MAG: class I fructose-bisphosphate aldolase family protein [Deltaproteobacteria bacterium]|nr:class I fructose-bisphosphate aldolase family protein [Deltaproteobacteria bacterium]
MRSFNPRLRHILDPTTGRTVIVPLDHGFTAGPLKGLVSMRDALDPILQARPNAVILHSGMLRELPWDLPADVGIILHLSGGTNLTSSGIRKVLVAKVEDALGLGADAVSIHVNLGNRYEAEMLADAGAVASKCRTYGLPLLIMAYVRGKKVKDEFDPGLVAHAARLASELGADVVKVPYTGSVESFRSVVQGCCAPVVIAGGPKIDREEDLIRCVQEAMKAGAAGISIGRNVFQHPNPKLLLRRLRTIVHSNRSLAHVSHAA